MPLQSAEGNFMLTIRKAIKSDAEIIYDLRNRAIIEKCSAYYSKEQLSLWTQGGVSDEFVQDVFETFFCFRNRRSSCR